MSKIPQHIMKALLEKYFEGATSQEEEEKLYKYFTQQDDQIEEDLKVYKSYFTGFTNMKAETVDFDLETLLKMEDRGQEKAEGSTKTLSFHLNLWKHKFQIAASFGLLLMGFYGGVWFIKSNQPSSQQLLSLNEDVREIKKILHQVQESSSASERIMAVKYSSESETYNDEIVEVLIKTLNTDPNLNVRLAACDALFKFKEYPQVNKAFINALSIQSDPAVQITLIDMLVEMKEKNAVNSMKKLVVDDSQLEIVKQKAEYALAVLL